jgi:hypothetical protein
MRTPGIHSIRRIVTLLYPRSEFRMKLNTEMNRETKNPVQNPAM